MLSDHYLPVRNATEKSSIWRNLSEDKLRKRMVALEQASQGHPEDAKAHSVREWRQSNMCEVGTARSLSLSTEQRLADDLAFICAWEGSVKEVSAVAIEELTGTPGLIFRLAVNDVINTKVLDTLKKMLLSLELCARRSLSREACTVALFSHVMELCENRIHGRLQSRHWRSPGHLRLKELKPLRLALRKIVVDLQQRTSGPLTSSGGLIQKLGQLCDVCQALDEQPGGAEAVSPIVESAVRKSYEICTHSGRHSLEELLRSHGFDPESPNYARLIQQINKIGRYWGLCVDMPETCRKYQILFENLELQCLLPYHSVLSSVFFKTLKNTDKTFLDCHVHAEVQLVVFYDLGNANESLKPRVIGASKAACYLCNLFVKKHGQFFLSKTHGQLYDQWTIPDLSIYSIKQRQDYRQIIMAMDKEMQAAIPKQPRRKREPHAGSWQCFFTPTETPTLSDAGTILSVTELESEQLEEPASITPRASPTISVRSDQTLRARPSPTATVRLSRSPSPTESEVSSLPAQSQFPLPDTHPYDFPTATQIPSPAESISDTPRPSPTKRSLSPSPPSIARMHLPGIVVLDPPNDHTSEATRHLPPLASTSTISIHALNTPLTGRFNSAQPLRWHLPGLYMIFEHEGQGSGEVTASNTETSENEAQVIYVDKMKPGEELSFHKAQNAAAISMALHQKTPGLEGGALQLNMRWLSCEDIALRA